MMTFRLNEVAYSCPQNLAECDWRQVSAVMGYQMSLTPPPALPKWEGVHSDVMLVNLKRELFCFLTGVPLKDLKKLTVEQSVRVFSMISWCRNAEIKSRPFKFFEKPHPQPLPKMEGSSIRYYLPAENFGDMSAIELAMANIYLLAISRGNKTAVFSLLATVCRPERADIEEFRNSVKWDGDCREKYNSVKADEAAKAFENGLEIGAAMAVLKYFGDMNEQFFKANAILTEGNDDEESERVGLYQNGEGQITMLMEIGSMNVFGNFEAVCEQNVHTVFLFLKDKQLKLNKLEAESEDD